MKKILIQKIDYVHVITCTRFNRRLKYAVKFYTKDSDSRLNKNSEKVLNKIRSILSKADGIENYSESIMSLSQYILFNNDYEKR